MNIHILTENELSQLRQLIDGSQHVVITAHKSPDGDAMGSALAWADYLRQQGKTAQIVLPDAYPDFLQWMPGSMEILRYDKKPDEVKAQLDAADLVCCLDYNELSRTEDLSPLIQDCKAPRVLVDHHLKPTVPCQLCISRPEMSSTSEMIFCIINQLGGYEAMTTETATCIYCGMMTDTGGFTYNSNRPEIFYIISLLLDKQVNKDKIYKRVYHNCSADCLRMRAHVILNKMRVSTELHTAYFTLSREDMKRYHYIKGDAEGLVNEPLKIKGMKLSISLREDTEKDNLILVSLRSSCGFHCAKMATHFFNGGGHEDAAGGKLFCSLQEAEQVVMRAVLAYRIQLK